MHRNRTSPALASAVTLAVLLAAGSGPAMASPRASVAAPGTDSQARLVPMPSPDRFVRLIDNPYFPLVPGTVFTYRGEVDGRVEIDRVHVTHETREILGVACTVVHDTVFVNGEVAEATVDWYAQDADGNVWYFGEDSKELDHGRVVSRGGSWRAGVNGAQPGILMKARPKVGDAYYQEHCVGVAEDEARVVSLEDSVAVPYGRFAGCLQIEERSRLEPEVRERKYYARGVGNVLETTIRGGRDRCELVRVEHHGGR